MKHCFTFRYYDEFTATFEIEGDWTLHDLAAYCITEVAGFDFDHAFGFYDNIRNPYKSVEKYTIFADRGEPEDGEPGVQKTKVSEVFEPEKRMILLFDYGDDWNFLLTCDSSEPSTKRGLTEAILSKEGTPPVQYPDHDE